MTNLVTTLLYTRFQYVTISHNSHMRVCKVLYMTTKICYLPNCLCWIMRDYPEAGRLLKLIKEFQKRLRFIPRV